MPQHPISIIPQRCLAGPRRDLDRSVVPMTKVQVQQRITQIVRYSIVNSTGVRIELAGELSAKPQAQKSTGKGPENVFVRGYGLFG